MLILNSELCLTGIGDCAIIKLYKAVDKTPSASSPRLDSHKGWSAARFRDFACNIPCILELSQQPEVNELNYGGILWKYGYLNIFLR